MKHTSTVLNVDDSPDDILLLQGACRCAKVSFRLESVRDGVKAMAYLRGDGDFSDREKYPFPDWVLLDIKLPPKSGFDVLAWIRAQPTWQQLPVAMFSASVFAEDVSRAYKLGANAFMVKEASLSHLEALVKALDMTFAAGQFSAECLKRLPGYKAGPAA